ncbi:MAG: ABC transporter ATP-binding protein [Clostridia bacterium]|nr:ABC transporter ATP-binding protein [Clostridia bacterium]
MLKTAGLSKTFKNAAEPALSDINLEIEDGEFICIVGPSGCGKSTLLNLIAGLETPTSGSIILDDKEVKGPGADRVVMFQEPALYPWLNVIDNVKFGMKLAGVPKSEQEKRAEKYLKMVHLWDFREYAVHELSGGMKQRTALARALTMDSRIMLMDEPFSALDKQTINKLRAELEAIWEETRRTIIYVTHSVEEALYFADRIIILADRPGIVKSIVKINLPRPRRLDSEEFVDIRKHLLDGLKVEVEKIEKEEYDRV